MLTPIFSAMLFQDATVSGLTSGQVTMLMIFAGAVTLSVLVQCAILISMAIAAGKARKEIVQLVAEFHGKAMPVIGRVSELVEQNGPKVSQTISHVEEIAAIARKKAVEIDSLTSEMVMRTRQQTRHVDSMMTHTLNKVEHLRDSVNHALMVPVRQAAGAIAAMKAMVEKLKNNLPQNLRYVAGFDHREAEERMGEGEDYHA
ncbi:MAG: hypothetical protein JSS87_04070 [Acidobacteria bacterium]|nr:hypothetical protein [Acidobacteriota bacterium]